MDILSLIFGFLFGLVTYRMIENLFGIGYAILFFKEIEKHSLLMLASVAESVSYIQYVKYKTMVESEVPENTIRITKNLDDHNFSLWKSTVINNLTSAYPKTIPPAFKTWEQAIKLLDKIYYSKRT
mgnify:CR=1 FL=1